MGREIIGPFRRSIPISCPPVHQVCGPTSRWWYTQCIVQEDSEENAGAEQRELGKGKLLCDGEGNEAIDIDHAKVVLTQCRDWKKKGEDEPQGIYHRMVQIGFSTLVSYAYSIHMSMDPLFNSFTFSRTLRGGVSVGV